MDEDTKSEAGDAIPIFVSPIATPLAGKKLTKKCLKLVKKGASEAHPPPLKLFFLVLPPREALHCLFFFTSTHGHTLFSRAGALCPCLNRVFCIGRCGRFCSSNHCSIQEQGHPTRREGGRQGAAEEREGVCQFCLTSNQVPVL